MSSSAEPEKDGAGEEKKDALDEWVDELDRLIGIEPMTEEEIAEQQKAAVQKKKGTDPALIIVILIVILVAAALLFYFGII